MKYRITMVDDGGNKAVIVIDDIYGNMDIDIIQEVFENSNYTIQEIHVQDIKKVLASNWKKVK